MPERYIMQLSIAPEVSMEFSAVLLCCGLFRCVHQLLPFGGQRVFRFFEFIGRPAEGAGEFGDAFCAEYDQDKECDQNDFRFACSGFEIVFDPFQQLRDVELLRTFREAGAAVHAHRRGRAALERRLFLIHSCRAGMPVPGSPCD